MAFLKPYPLPPKEFEKIWGSTHVEPWFPATGRKIGEVWFVEYGSPVLVKFLFTTENLSVQVHPGDEQARRDHNCPGKTEMWHILRAEPGAKIALGLTQAVTTEELRRAAMDGGIMELLRWIPVSAGDTWFVPAGAVHAIGAGIALCEVQQHSDVTYRLFDYGRPRELHLNQGLAVTDTSFRAMEVVPGTGPLVDCPYFAVDLVDVDGEVSLTPKPGKQDLLIVHEGSGFLNGEPFRLGQVWKWPAGAGIVLQGSAKMLRVSY